MIVSWQTIYNPDVSFEIEHIANPCVDMTDIFKLYINTLYKYYLRII